MKFHSPKSKSVPNTWVFGSVLCLAAVMLFSPPVADACDASGAGRPSDSDTRSVKISSTRKGDTTSFFVENNELCEVTMTFDFAVENMDSTVQFPYTATFQPGTFAEAFVLKPSAGTSDWSYAYTNYYKLGCSNSRHDDDVEYMLPYAPGKKYKVTQSANGSYSHKGSNKYAIDWKMSPGTPIHAARSGLVVKTKGDSDKGGPSMKFDKYNNFILIRHQDGTLGHYCHLQKNGVFVQPGDRVEAGQFIGLSGNTGFSSGPHLHFCVFQTVNGRERVSVPVRFRTANRSGETLYTGRTYTAVSSEQITAALSEGSNDLPTTEQGGDENDQVEKASSGSKSASDS